MKFNVLPVVFTAVIACCLSACDDKTSVVSASRDATTQTIDTRPNILVIVADDLGFADLGAYGGEIDTPNIDQLAQAGLMLSDFHTAPTCSPTRSMLLSGTDHHIAGLGSMAEFMRFRAPHLLGQPGYEGYLNHRVVSLPELMQDAGYETFMAGKWHLGHAPEQQPLARGFDRAYSLLDGGAAHFNAVSLLPPKKEATFLDEGKPVALPAGFYSTDFYTQKMQDYLASSNKEKPFFAYLAYTAPHWPLQAPEASIAKYHGRYDGGYEQLFKERFERQKALGFVPANAAIPALPVTVVPWDSLSVTEQKRSIKSMEIYSAMVDDMDKAIGRLIADLKQKGLYDNTLIFFMSDNGAENADINFVPILPAHVAQCCDTSYDNMGRVNSYVMYGPGWARASGGVNHLFKSSTAEGGIRTPAILSYPALKHDARRFEGFTSVMDVMPTVLDFAQTKHPGTRYEGREVAPMRGRSMAAVLRGDTEQVHAADEEYGWELFGNKAARKGDWKITYIHKPLGSGQWALFNLVEDPSEQHDLAANYPEKLGELLAVWARYEAEVGVKH